MDRYVVLTTIFEQVLANKTCEALEDAGIPVMLEHREVVNDGERASNYRVLVPSQFTQTAMRLAKLTSGHLRLHSSGRMH